MKRRISFAGLAILALVLATTTPADAANKEHQQLMADLRMLQEQSQQLQNLIGQVADAVKATNGRIDQQIEANRKSLADQKLVIDSLSNDVRVVKEKLDDNNVRIGQLTTEVTALRQALQSSARASTSADTPSGSGTQPGGAPPAGGASLDSPQHLWETAYGDYTAGQYEVAVLGFQSYIDNFPKTDKTDDAQVYICRAYIQDKKDDKAVEACDTAIRMYPNGDVIPEAYFYKGLALSNLKNLNGARDAWEELLRKFPESTSAVQAKNQLDRLRRPD
jgi:TolA-binding protein